MGRRAQPSLGTALLLLMVMFGAMAVGMFIVVLSGRGAELDLLLLGTVQVFAMVLVLLLGVRWVGVGARSIFALRPTPFWMVAISAPLALVCAILSGALEASIEQVFPMPEEFAVHLARLLYPETTGQWVRIVAIAVIIVPLGEEMLFRGLFLRGFVLRYGAVPGLACSSLFFAFVHLNPWGFVPIFLAGWLLGWLVLRSGSLWPSVLLHGLYNLYSVLMLYTSLKEVPSAEALSQADAGIWGSSMMVAFSVLVLVGCIVIIGRRGRRALPWTDSCNAAAG